MGPSADAVARFQHDEGQVGIPQRVGGAEAGCAGADDGDIDRGGEGGHAYGSSMFVWHAEATPRIAVITRAGG